jgi:S-adenosylmethionine:tRNA-ribosyltransferase-isomerase (queuine synthetase)
MTTAVEFLFLERLGPTRWKCMVTPGRKMRVGATATIDDVCLRVEKITADGERIVAFDKGLSMFMPVVPCRCRRMSIGPAMNGRGALPDGFCS